jgi:ribosomal protein L4
LIVVSEKANNENLIKSAKNLEDVKVILAAYLNPSDLSKYRNVCFY